MRRSARSSTPWVVALLAVALLPAGGGAQDAQTRAFLQGVAAHFNLPPAEVDVLARWSIPAEEIPVALYIAGRASLSPEVVFSVRRGGTAWVEVARRYGVGSSVFHTALGGAPPSPLLARAYADFEGRAPREWDAVRLSDDEVVALVNLRFLMEALRVPAGRALEARASAGSWIGAYVALGGRGF